MPHGGNPAKLFINYRREDTAPYAGRLYDRLVAHFGADQVFMDIDKIEPGEDFVEVIQRKVGACEIAIISIGPNWLSATDAAGQRRLDDSEDFVRMEIIAALERKIRVIPVLVGGARMPRRQDLPKAIASLSRRNAIELSETRFHADVSRLIEAIEKPPALPEKKAEPPPAPVTLIAEPALPVKLSDREKSPETSALRPPPGPPPVPVALTTETVSETRLPDTENPPEIPAPRPLAGQDQPPILPPAPRPQARAATTTSKMPWIVGGIGCFGLILFGFFVVLMFYLASFDPAAGAQNVGYGKHLEYNGGDLYYTSSVTETEARKLGEYLVKIEYFDGKPNGVQLNKTGATYEVRACIKQDAEIADSNITYFKNLGRSVSLTVFDGRPVVVHLCDTNLKTLRVVTP